MFKKIKKQKNNLPENYSNSLYFLEHMFASPAITVNEITIESISTKYNNTQKQVEVKSLSKKQKSPLNKLTNIKNPISKINILIFSILLVFLTFLFSTVFISTFVSNDHNEKDVEEQHTIVQIDNNTVWSDNIFT